jgi:putative sterol carrier protein
MKAGATEEFFDDLARRGHEPLLEKASGTLRFELLDGRKRHRWLVTVDKGDVSISRRNAHADCVVRADKTVFDRVSAGRMNAMAALLRGAIDIEGKVELLAGFQRLFPGPPRSRVRRQAVRKEQP